MPRMGFMPTTTPVPSALNSVPAGTRYIPPQRRQQKYLVVPGFFPLRAARFPTNRRGMEAAERYILRVLEARGCPSKQAAFFRGDAACMELYRLLRRVRNYLSRMPEGGERISPSFGALALQSNPAHYGSPDADEIKRGLAGVGAAGFGIMGALLGAAVGASIQVRGKPLKDGWLYGSIAGFMLPVILLAPKTDEAA